MKSNFTGMACALGMGMTLLAGATASADELKATFNATNVILPSSQYTPAQPYSAEVWVVTGDRYSDPFYNQILATPANDADGNDWFSPVYLAGDDWSRQQAPFSSDETYLGQKSYRWVTSDIMGDIYLRRTFTLDQLPGGSLFLACGHDDAPSEWYINGTLVHAVTDGWNNDEYVLLSDEHKALLKTDGTENLLAVHVHQNWGGAFADCGLYAADMSLVKTFLPTLDDGPWPCTYYMLNYNRDLDDARSCEWYGENEDESDWIHGVGPFSNDQNIFFTTEWPSQVRPILVRRHFTLTSSDLTAIEESELTMACSYDENPVMYLNGVQIWNANGWNDNDYAKVILESQQKALFKEGDNVLAVSLMQGAGGGHLDYGLFIESPVEIPGTSGITAPEPSRNGDARIFNLHGQYVGDSDEALSNGVYIRNGKKIMVTGK